MNNGRCEESNAETPRDRAKALVLKTLGVRRVAAYVGVAEDTVYQGLSRGSDKHPVPVSWVPKIVQGAKADGIDAPIGVLWPAMAEAAQ
jgi:hypothetical protein